LIFGEKQKMLCFLRNSKNILVFPKITKPFAFSGFSKMFWFFEDFEKHLVFGQNGKRFRFLEKN